MDSLTVFHTMLNSALITVLLFGAYLVFTQVSRSKSKSLFIGVMVVFSVALLFDSYDQITRSIDEGYDASPLNYNALLTGVLSQPILLLLYFSLLFSMRRSLKIMAIQCSALLLLFVAIWVVDYFDEGRSIHDTFDSMEQMLANFSSPLVFLRFVIIFVQILMSLTTLLVSYRLVPIYQRYIEQFESNVAYNILWVREIGYMTMLITFVYTIDVIFLNATSSITYYIVVTVAFARMINVFLQYKTLDNYDELYTRLGVKWSLSKLWYVDEVKHDTLCQSEYMYNMVERWITSEKPYVNPDFSFNDVVSEFATVGYNEFNQLLGRKSSHNFQSYIRELRIDEAVRLMNDESKHFTFKEISYKVGFENSSSFARAFKAVKGITPSEWRTENS